MICWYVLLNFQSEMVRHGPTWRRNLSATSQGATAKTPDRKALEQSIALGQSENKTEMKMKNNE